MVVSTDSAGADAAMRRRLPLDSEFRHIAVVPCMAHQNQLVFVNVLRSHKKLEEVTNEALTVITWFNSHSRALGLLHECQMQVINKRLALMTAAPTRWATHFYALKRLYDLRSCFNKLLEERADELRQAAGSRKV